MKKIFLFLSLACLCVSMIKAQSIASSLQGKVIDEVDGSALVGVSIYFTEINRGTSTDVNGYYKINNLPARNITVQVSYLGHQTIIENINLNQVNERNFVLKESTAMMNEVVVSGFTGDKLLKESPSPISVISNSTLLHTASSNIIDAIAKQPGISQITTSSGISKPIIRGLGYNRVVVVNDDIRQEGQQWGDEHGIEIDPQTVHSVEVLKGPASLMYGSDAMAGVLIFKGAPILSDGQMRLQVGSEYQTNNGLFDYTIHLEGNQHGFVWNWRYSDKMAHAYQNKYDGYVLGSQFSERAVSGLLGVSRHWGYSHVHLDYYHLTPSMVEGERDDETGSFILPYINEDGDVEERIATNNDLKTYDNGMPYQQIHHYKAVWDNSIFVGDGALKFIVGYQQNRRQEFEELETPNTPGLDMQMHTVNYDAHYVSAEFSGWKVAAGLNGMLQQSLNRGEEVLIPNYHLWDIGTFATMTKDLNQWHFSGGLRFDYRQIQSESLMEEDELRFENMSRHFHAVSGSLGAVYNLTDGLNLRANLSRGFRAPNISELASNGEHEGTFRYEVGNTNLQAEYSLQFDLGADYSSRYVSAQLSLFASRIDNYIFIGRMTDDSGNAVYEDETPVYGYKSGDVRLLGGETSVDIHPVERLHFENTFSYVSGQFLHQNEVCKYLPMMPAPRWTTELKYDIVRDGKILNNTFVSIGLEYNMRQNHYYATDDTETATPSYALLNMTIGSDFRIHGRKIATLCITADNLTDEAYQSHLSRLKYAPINKVTGRQGVYNMGRNFGIKLLVPIDLTFYSILNILY